MADNAQLSAAARELAHALRRHAHALEVDRSSKETP